MTAAASDRTTAPPHSRMQKNILLGKRVDLYLAQNIGYLCYTLFSHATIIILAASSKNAGNIFFCNNKNETNITTRAGGRGLTFLFFFIRKSRRGRDCDWGPDGLRAVDSCEPCPKKAPGQ